MWPVRERGSHTLSRGAEGEGAEKETTDRMLGKRDRTDRSSGTSDGAWRACVGPSSVVSKHIITDASSDLSLLSEGGNGGNQLSTLANNSPSNVSVSLSLSLSLCVCVGGGGGVE